MPKFQPNQLKGNDFLLSNGSGAFLLIPVAQIRNERHKEHELENPSKYYGFFWGTQKIVEGWFATADGHLLSPEIQSGFQTDLVTAEKIYQIGQTRIVEEIFVPDGFPAIAISYSGAFGDLEFQPELDIRGRYEHPWVDYKSKIAEGICFTSASGYWAVIGEGEPKQINQYRYKFYPDDFARNDIAERWSHSPCMFKQGASSKERRFYFGFGKEKDEALRNYEKLKVDLEALKRAKSERVKSLLLKHRISTKNELLNKAFGAAVVQFLSIQNGDVLPASGDRWFAGDSGWLRDAAVSLEAYFELGLLERAKRTLNFWLSEDRLNSDGIFADKLEPEPQWRAVDATLWLLRRAGEYAVISGDRAFLEDKGDLLRASLERLIDKRVDAHGLVACKPYETWMDTKFTPREGYPVEVQALFAYDCLLFAKLFEERTARRLARIASATINSINTLYKCKTKVEGVERRYLADHLSPSLQRGSAITPNQLIALDCGLIEEELESDILAVVRAKLAGKGVRTLAPDEVGYFEKHVGDSSYHRGCQWPWLNYMAAKREIKQGKIERAFNHYIYPLIEDILGKSIGGVPELYNGDGTDAIVPKYQTWSLASFIIACKEYERACGRDEGRAQPLTRINKDL